MSLSEVQTIEFAPRKPIGRLAMLLHEVATMHKVSITKLTGRSCRPKFSHVRQEFFYLAAATTKASLGQIGRACGNRDHTTVLYGIRAHCFRTGEQLPRSMFYSARFWKQLNG